MIFTKTERDRVVLFRSSSNKVNISQNLYQKGWSSIRNYLVQSNYNVTRDQMKKPLLKWVGGKTRIAKTLIKQFPKEVNDYHEIFVGGGSVLLHYLFSLKEGHLRLRGKIYAYDYNEPLIGFYKNVQSNHLLLYKEIVSLQKEYLSTPPASAAGQSSSFSREVPVDRNPETKEEAIKCRESYFYWVRSRYNRLTDLEKKTIQGSAMFLFLNKTCFRGLFRVGPNGFNVPYGHYKRPNIIS